jgi:hypothetical protein
MHASYEHLDFSLPPAAYPYDYHIKEAAVALISPDATVLLWEALHANLLSFLEGTSASLKNRGLNAGTK